MADAFEVQEEFRFLGRTFAEYCRLFGLDPSSLGGHSVLDCPGGPGSFTAVASTLANSVVAVDPMYGRTVTDLQTICHDAVEQTVAQLQAQREAFVWSEYGNPATRGRYLRRPPSGFWQTTRDIPAGTSRLACPSSLSSRTRSILCCRRISSFSTMTVWTSSFTLTRCWNWPASPAPRSGCFRCTP